MHYYKKNIGDYAKKAGRLSMLQHGAYTLLIDTCYDRECFPTLEQAIEWTWSSTAEECAAVEFVLKKFFTLEGDVYVQKRIQEEINDYHAKAQENQRIALEREAKRRDGRTQLARTVHVTSPDVNEAPPNQEPITNNHKPITTKENNKKKKDTTSDEVNFYDVPQKIINDFKAHRKLKKAAITQTAIDQIKAEAEKARISLANALTLCCSRGWVGFEAGWIKNEQPHARGSPYQSRQEKTQEWVDKLLGNKKNERPPDIIDIN